MVKVSVIVPVYNTEKYLRRCVDSILNQTLKDIEIICVNDASPDNSITVLKEYEAKYPELIKVIDSKENVKLGGARNLGLKIATGEYISFIDSDDFIDSEMLAEMYDCAKKSDLDIVGCDIRNVDENLKEIGITKVNSETQTGILTEEQHRRLITDGSNVPPKIFKRELIEKNHLAFPFKLLYEDYYFITLAFVFAKSFDIVRKPFYNYFTNTQSISRKKDTDGQVDKLQVMNLLIEKFKEIGLYEKYKEELEYLYTMFCYMNSSKMCIIAYSKPNYKALYELRKNIREQIPDYRQKKYFKNKVSKLNKFLILLNDISPRLYVFAYKIYQFIKK